MLTLASEATTANVEGKGKSKGKDEFKFMLNSPGIRMHLYTGSFVRC